ncbi:MAG: GTPase, partial [Ghiorsea sp.]|nr:GTPase [Ghiorsea sp.]
MSHYENIKQDVLKLSTPYQEEKKRKVFAEHIEHKLANFKPTVMIYGVYNAGKSTLVNAIFGQEELAKTGDTPETSKVSSYQYKGYTLYDTPGINAPIVHEEVTAQHLAKCELVIFVLSNDGSFEEAYIYEKIGELIQAKKPILIAMNNKSGIDIHGAKAQQETAKVSQHLATIGQRMGIAHAEEQVSIAFVDAKMALEGKLTNEAELIEESNMPVFENMMDKLLGDAGHQEVQQALNQYITSYITDTLSCIDDKIDAPEIKRTQSMITDIEKMRQSVQIEIR